MRRVLTYPWPSLGFQGLVVFVLLLSLIVSCDDDVIVRPSSPPALEGRVVDAAGDPVVGAHVGIFYEFSPLVAVLPTPSVRFSILQDDTTVVGPDDPVPLKTILYQNYPNPFYPTTRLHYVMAEPESVRIGILDQSRRPIRLLVDSPVDAGSHEVTFNGTYLPNGLYIARLEIIGSDSTTVLEKRMFLQTDDPNGLRNTFHMITGADGRFQLLLEDLPIGENVTFMGTEFDSLGQASVLNTIRVCARIGPEQSPSVVCADVDLSDLTGVISVELKLP